MNPEEPPIIMEMTLVEMVRQSGPYGTYAAYGALALWLLGMALIFIRPSMQIRSAYLIACFLPCGLGVLGFATGFMKAFSALGAAGIQDGMKFIAAFGEVATPMVFGFAGSGVSLMLASIVWMRSVRQPASDKTPQSVAV
jgi:hypothetical protein